ncbi:helix-turn-helix domain-containing protein [Streptomyces goshikiensis]|uniref:helix-turn-helix domain-containing protein n=1 Tax=Streptomyces goshikiensis TaxID=1942 RepID=UPI0036814910
MAKAANKESAGGATRLVSHLAKVFRERERLTQKELGAMLGYSAAAISALETGAQPASDEMLVKLEAVIGDGLGVFEVARELVLLDKYPSQFKDYAMLEQRAVSISSYVTLVIDGLFQTEAYARALIGGGYPPLSDQRIDELVAARMARQALLDRAPLPHIELVIEESVLHRVVGNRAVMREQLLHLISCARRRNVTLQVLALDRGGCGEHAGMRGDMKLVETEDHKHLLYVEPQDESLLISDAAKVSSYTRRYAKILAQALGTDESLALIERLAGESE